LTNLRPGISQHSDMVIALLLLTPLCLSIWSYAIKRMVRNSCILTIVQFFHSPFLIKLSFCGQMHDQWYCSPPTNVHPVTTDTHFQLIKQSGEAKRIVRKHRALTILHFFHPNFFNKIAICWANMWSMVLQPTDQFLPRHNCRPLQFIKTEQGGKNGE
jgi:hypothetical protein